MSPFAPQLPKMRAGPGIILFALLVAARAYGAEPDTTATPSVLTRTGIDAFSLYDIGNVRGLDASRVIGNYRWNGLPVLNQTRSAREGSESYDVQTGLRAIETGFVYPGGVIDLSGKDAKQHARHFTAGITAAGAAYGAADIGTGSLRINAARDVGDLPVRGLGFSSSFAAFATALELAPGTTISADFEWQKWAERGEQAAVSLDGLAVPGAPPARTLLGQSWGGTRTTDRIYSLRITHRLSDDWNVRAGIARLDERIDDEDYFGRLLPGERYELNYARDREQRFTSDTLHAELRGAVRAGGILHRLTIGATALRNRASLSGAASTVLGTAALRAPTEFAAVSVAPLGPAFEAQRATDTGIHLGDSMELSDRLTLLAALRMGRYRQTGANVVEPADERYLLKSAGATYGFGSPGTRRTVVYASYGEALEQGTTVPLGASNAERVLPSFIARQVEAGIRFAPAARLEVALAAFQARKGYAYPDAGGAFVQDGEQVHNGMELKAVGEPASQTRIYGVLLLLKSRARGSFDPAVEGQPALDVPPRRLKMVVERSLAAVEGLSAHAEIDAYSSRAADAYGRATLPGYGVLGVGAQLERRWSGGKRYTLRVSVENLANRAYWGSVAGGQLVLGQPRAAYIRLETSLD